MLLLNSARVHDSGAQFPSCIADLVPNRWSGSGDIVEWMSSDGSAVDAGITETGVIGFE